MDEWVDVGDIGDMAPNAPPTIASAATVPLPIAFDDPAYTAFVCDEAHPAPVFKAAGLCYVLRLPNTNVHAVKQAARMEFQCNECVSRAGAYARDLGPDGPVFFHGLAGGLTAPCAAITKLRDLAVRTCTQDSATAELVVVTASTYAPAQEGCAPCGTPYFHWTVTPAEVSAPAAAARYEALKNYYGQMDTRLAKLTVPEAVESVKIMLEEQLSLERPAHYASVLDWVSKLQALAATECASAIDGRFEGMNAQDQTKLRVLAIMSGRVDGRTHLDFHQADNIVDFLTMPSRDALRAEMDRRSDPQFYMVSQLNRRLAAEGVTSKYLIGLTWDGKFADDLDIHVTTPAGKEIYYGNKAADGCKLDFDANVTKGEAHPCENVSCKPGRFRVRVNNYTRRTFHEPVPFQVVCRQAGKPDVVHDGLWGVNRAKGSMIEVCTHVFDEATDADSAPTMSANAAARAKALDAEWTSRVGAPTATVATTDSLAGKAGIDVVLSGAGGGAGATTTLPAQVSRAFMDMAAAGANTAGAKPKKPFLSESCKRLPTTVAELVAHVRAHPACVLCVHPRDHAPGYLVDITTKEAGVRKSDLPAPCHFHDKHAHPVKPVPGTVGNARIDGTWLGARTEVVAAGVSGLVRVRAVVDTAGGCAFLALHGATLPLAGRTRAVAFPLASGFYPVDLSADFHAHRERWTFCHTQLQPSMPAAQCIKAGAVPMVGAFLTGETAVVYLDGAKLALRVGG